MIRPLRQRHRVMVCTLGVILPLAFLAGIAARQAVPATRTVPAELDERAMDFGKVVWTKTDIWPGQRIITVLRRNAVGSVAAEFRIRDLVKPDLLIYWAAGNDTAIERLPENARLLGGLSNRRPLPLSSDVRGENGRFVLYSLANHEVVAASKAFIIQKD